MKEYLADLVQRAPDPLQGRNLAREYLQARLLAVLQRSGAMLSLAFHGGTALRFLYAHGRYSEDLDFALETNQQAYDLRAYLEAIRSEMKAEGYTVEIKVRDGKLVHSAFVRFPGLLFELGLTARLGEVLALKIEVDTNPPQGAGLATTVVRRHVVLQLQHHDPASLLAGKLHAIIQRAYTKGRDVYDLLWYLSDPNWPPPNLVMLNNALAQTNWDGEPLTGANWKGHVRRRLLQLDWNAVVEDVRPFIEPGFDPGLLTLSNLERVLGFSAPSNRAQCD